MMLSQCGRVRLGNFVDPKYTVGALSIPSFSDRSVA
jgi:amidase